MRFAGLVRLFRHGAFGAVAVFFLSPDTGAAAADSALVQAAQQRAQSGSVHKDAGWLTLLHFPTGGNRSVISDPSFFLSPDGLDNPEAELRATIEALHAPAETNETDHARCRFPARYDWLVAEGIIDPAAVSVPDCAVFEQAIAHLQPTSITISFPSAYLNSPASMFGHTLLVFDGRGEDRILSKAVNFAARTQATCGPLFTIAGLFGGFKGYYAVTPYYDLVEKYNAINQRDIWEYELNLTEEEVRRVFGHAWEMQNRFAPYYFFSGNCSYHLLMLLNAARPDLALDADFGFQVIPLDTIRSLRKRGLIKDVSFRPSKATEIRGLVEGLAPVQRNVVAETLNLLQAGENHGNGIAEASAGEIDCQRAMLQLTAELWQQDYAQGRIDAATYRRALVPLLGARAKLGRLEPGERWTLPHGVEPDLGHSAWRVQVGAGTSDENFFGELRLRPAYHELTDAPAGFDHGSQIVFFDAAVRVLESPGKLRLQQIDYVNIRSFAASESFHSHESWKVRVGGQRVRGSQREGWSHTVHTGKGKTVRMNGGDTVTATIDMRGDVGGVWNSGWRAGTGAALAWLRTGDRFSALAEAQGQQLWGDGSPQERWGLRFQGQWHLNLQWGVVLEASRIDEGDGEASGEIGIALKRHFD